MDNTKSHNAALLHKDLHRQSVDTENYFSSWMSLLFCWSLVDICTCGQHKLNLVGCVYVCIFPRYVCITTIIISEEVKSQEGVCRVEGLDGRRIGGNNLILMYSNMKFRNNLKSSHLSLEDRISV